MNSDQELRKALAALKKSEDEKHAILMGLQDLVTVFYLDPQLRIVWTNRDLVKELRIANPTTLANYCYEVMHGRTQACRDCAAVMALEKGLSQETENKLDDGRFFIRRGVPVEDSAGGILGVVQIALNVTKHKQTEEGLKTTYELLHALLENSPTPILVSRRDGHIEMVNRAWEKIVGFKREQAVGQFFHDIFPKKIADQFNRINNKVLESGVPTELEESIDFPATGPCNFYTVKFPIQDALGQRAAVGSISVDVTARKRIERELTEREAELRRKSEQLGEINTALRVLLRQRDEDQKELEERIVSNVNELVLPYVRKLKGMHLNEAQTSYLEIVETHLNDIVTPFLRQIVSHYPHMTAKELQVATFVKEGKSNKEIADLMNVSVNAVEIHRYNLRKKLSLQNKKVNLRSYLLALNKLSP
jgi:PAS domain S-box-containing protein